MKPANRPHSSFGEFLDCVSRFAGQEELEVLSNGPSRDVLWMMGGLPQFSEFQTSAGREALREVWGRLPELKKLGKGAIHVALTSGLQGKFLKDNSAIIASATWSCILLHGDRIESGQQYGDELAELGNGGLAAASPQQQSRSDEQPIGGEVVNPRAAVQADRRIQHVKTTASTVPPTVEGPSEHMDTTGGRELPMIALKKRGRPQKISDEKKVAALSIRAAGGSLRGRENLRDQLRNSTASEKHKFHPSAI